MRLKFRRQCEISWKHSHLMVTNEYYAKYETIASVLDRHPELLAVVHEDLKSALRAGSRGGDRFQYTSEQVVRILISQVVEGLSLRGIVVRIDDSTYLRDFVRIHGGPMMDYTTLCKLKNAIRPETWERVNHLLAKVAVKEEQITGDRVRMDTTLTETNIHWPTDSSLLWDTYRVLSRFLGRVRDEAADALGDRRLQPRRVKRLATRIARMSNHKGRSARKLKRPYRRLIQHVEGICDLAQSVCRTPNRQVVPPGLCEVLEHYEALGRRAIAQARRRVLEGQPVRNEEKLFSIFEPHTELIVRGKAGRPVEFGHMIQIQQTSEKFITEYEVFAKKPVEHTLVERALRSHRDLFGSYPDQLAADKGYYQSMKAITKLEKKIEVVAIGKKGKRSVEETERESDPLFRLAQRFRAGVEGTISFLKRILGLSRCLNKGWDHFRSTVGTTIFAHNLLVLARC